MRMYPSVLIKPDQAHSRRRTSSAEERIFVALRDGVQRAGYAGLHSLNLTRHHYKLLAEIDFVIVCPEGVYCLEVKGGTVDYREGLWHYPYGTSSEGPFKQVSSAMFALKETLTKDFTLDFDINEVTFGYGVVFTDSIFSAHSVEWDLETVLDANGIFGSSSYMERYLERLIHYWRAKKKGEILGRTRIQAIVTCLRPSFETVQALRANVEDADAGFISLTQEQYAALDFSETADRIIYEGGAGTGKTLLALECARRHASQGEQVLFLYFNPLLASYLADVLEMPGVRMLSVHQWMAEIAGKPEQFASTPSLRDLLHDRYTTQLPDAVCQRYTEGGPLPVYDLLIVDEAQDVLSMNYLVALDYCLKGGLEKGRWRFFMDSKNQASIIGAFENEAQKQLTRLHPHRVPLTKNCRNTSEIIKYTSLWTGLEFCNDSRVKGPEVSVGYYSGREQHRQILLGLLKEFEKSLFNPGDITILSDRSFGESIASDPLVCRKYQISVLDRSNVPSFPFNTITFSSIPEFKGLENRAIIVSDLQIGDFSNVVGLLYVAYTRARFKLCVLLDDSLKTAVTDRIIHNMLAAESKNV